MDKSGDRPEVLKVRLYQEGPIPLSAAFQCRSGELLVLVGPSGSGKSTILRAIAGLYRPKEGEIVCAHGAWFNAQQKRWVPPQQRRVGIVFQDYALFPHLSALENIVCALGHLPRAERRRRAGELLERVNLGGFDARRPHALSGGQRQRVAIARALAREPAVLLLDEPFSAVDQVTRHKLQRELVLLRRRLNIPTVLVTHDLDEAAALGDRICVLHRGQTLQAGPPLEVMRQPRNVTVARLMAVTNIFEGEIVEHRPAQAVTVLKWGRHLLGAKYVPHFAVGTRVSWVIPSADIVMHRRERPSRGERENPVTGEISEIACLGESTTVTLRSEDRHEITFQVSTHVAQRNGLAGGKIATVSLLAEGIHIMPFDSDKDPDRKQHPFANRVESD